MLRRPFFSSAAALCRAYCLLDHQSSPAHRRVMPLSLLCYLRYRPVWLLPLLRPNFFVAFWELSLLALPSLRLNALLAQFTA